MEILKSQGIASERIVDPEKTNGYSLATFRDGSINSTLFLPGDNAHIPSPQMGKRFLSILHGIIGVARPQILATYGSFWLSDRILSIGKINSLKTAFLLQNHSYVGKKTLKRLI